MALIAPFVASTTVLTGIGFVVLVMIYYTAANPNYLGNSDPIGKEAGFAAVVEAASDALRRVGTSAGSRPPTIASIRCCDGT
jgi:hypothetical protein